MYRFVFVCLISGKLDTNEMKGETTKMKYKPICVLEDIRILITVISYNRNPTNPHFL